MVLRIQVYSDIGTTPSSTLHTRTNYTDDDNNSNDADHQLSIGRHEAMDITFSTDKSVSRQHCKILVKDNPDSEDGSATLIIETPGKSGSFLAVPKFSPPPSSDKKKNSKGDDDDTDDDATDDEEDVALTSQIANSAAPSVGSLPPPPTCAPAITDFYTNSNNNQGQGQGDQTSPPPIELQRLLPTHTQSILPNRPIFIQFGRNASSTVMLTYIPTLTFSGSKLNKDQLATLEETIPDKIGGAWTDMPTSDVHFMVVANKCTPCTKQILGWALKIPFCTAAWLEQVLEQDPKVWPTPEQPTASESFWTEQTCDPQLLKDFVLLTSMSKKSNEEEKQREIKALAEAVGMQLTNRVTKAMEQDHIVISIQMGGAGVKTPKKKNVPMVSKEALAKAITTQTNALVDVDGNTLRLEKEEEEEEPGAAADEEEDDPDKTIVLDSPVVLEQPKKKAETPATGQRRGSPRKQQQQNEKVSSKSDEEEKSSTPPAKSPKKKAASPAKKKKGSSPPAAAEETEVVTETATEMVGDPYKTPAPSGRASNKRTLEEASATEMAEDDSAFKTPAPSKRSRTMEESPSSPPESESPKESSKKLSKSSRKTTTSKKSKSAENEAEEEDSRAVSEKMDVEESEEEKAEAKETDENNHVEDVVEEVPQKKKVKKAKKPLPPLPDGLTAASSDGWFDIAPSDPGQRKQMAKRNRDALAEENILPPAAESVMMKIPSFEKSKAAKRKSASVSGAFPRRKGVRDYKGFRKNTVVTQATRRIVLVSILPKETEQQIEAQKHQEQLEREQRKAEDLFQEGSHVIKKRKRRA